MSERLARQSFLGADSEERLGSFTAGIVGLGGGGSHVVQQLAHLGVRHFVIVDHDVVEESNLNRIVGATVNDVVDRTPKVKMAERVIRGITPDAEISIIADRWQHGAEQLRAATVVFGCVDSFSERDQLERFARRFLMPYLDIGMDVHPLGKRFSITGQVARSVPGEPCLWCLGLLNEKALAEEARRYGAAGIRPQVVWPNGVLASAAVGLFVELVTPWHELDRPVACLEYDGNRHTLTPSNRLKFVADGTCDHHRVTDVGDPFFTLKS